LRKSTEQICARLNPKIVDIKTGNRERRACVQTYLRRFRNEVERKNRTIASVIERNKVRLIATMQLYDIGKVELFISDSLQTLWRGICSQNVLA